MAHTLLNVPEALLQLILCQLHLSDSLANFRLCSNACREVAESLFWRTLRFRTVREENLHQYQDISNAEQHIERLINRITDQKDRIRYHVRHFVLGEFKYEKPPDSLSSAVITTILKSFTNLTDFSWRVSSNEAPLGMVEALHRFWPRARLHIVQGSLNRHRLNNDLLSSPQLYLLDITTFGESLDHRRFAASELPASELPALTHLIGHHASLRILRLQPVVPVSQYFGRMMPGPLQLDIRSDTQLPDLEELMLPAWYNSTPEHMQCWVRCMNWEALRKLHIRSHFLEIEGRQDSLLRAITGLVPNLKALTWDVAYGILPDMPPWQEDELIGFIKSIKSLEEIHLMHEITQKSCFTILQQHGSSLRRLNIISPGGAWNIKPKRKALNNEWIQNLLNQAPQLEELLFSLQLTELRQGNSIVYRWPIETIETLSKFQKLRFLHMEIELGNRNIPFIHFLPDNSALYPKEELCKELIISTRATFLKHNPYCSLEKIELLFHGNPWGWSSLQWQYKIYRIWTYPSEEETTPKVEVKQWGVPYKRDATLMDFPVFD